MKSPEFIPSNTYFKRDFNNLFLLFSSVIWYNNANKTLEGEAMRLLLILLGLLPFAIGGLMNWYIISQNAVPSFFLIALLVLLIWGGIAFWGRRRLEAAQVIFSLNLAPFLVLLLLAVQELVFHAYWFNPVGVWTQIFYLPLMSVSFTLTVWSHSSFTAYGTAFILLVAASLAGCKTAETVLS